MSKYSLQPVAVLDSWRLLLLAPVWLPLNTEYIQKYYGDVILTLIVHACLQKEKDDDKSIENETAKTMQETNESAGG